MEALWGEMTLCNDPTEGFLQPNPHTAMLFSPFGCIYQPTSPCPTLSAHTEPTSQGNCWKWHHILFDTYNVCYSIKAAWRVMQTLEIWADTKSFRDILCLFKDYLVYFPNCRWLKMAMSSLQGDTLWPCSLLQTSEENLIMPEPWWVWMVLSCVHFR